VKPTLKAAAERRIRQHPEETYQGRDRQQQREPADQRTRARHQRGTGESSPTANQRYSSAGSRRHLPPTPEETGWNPAPLPDRSRPGICRRGSERAGHQPECERLVVKTDERADSGHAAISVYLAMVATIPFRIHTGNGWGDSRD